MSTTAPDLFTSLRTGWADAVQQWMDSSQTLWDDLAASFTAAGTPGAGMPWAGSRTTRAGATTTTTTTTTTTPPATTTAPMTTTTMATVITTTTVMTTTAAAGSPPAGCHGACDCCEPDADVVVHARVGERRIVPLNLHNPWRRERDVTLEVGPWHVCCGDGLTVVAVLEEEQLTLQPCEDRVVRLVVGVTVTAGNDTGGNDTGGSDSGGKDPAATAGTPRPVRPPMTWAPTSEAGPGSSCRGTCRRARAPTPTCRFEGAARPLRVAVVVSPAVCDPVEVGSDCGCCS